MPQFLTNAAFLTTANAFLSGATTLGFFIAALYFLKFWKHSLDRLFLLFALSFALLGIQKVAVSFWTQADERGQILLYGLRLIAFLVILVAIIDKNRVDKTRTVSPVGQTTKADAMRSYSSSRSNVGTEDEISQR